VLTTRFGAAFAGAAFVLSLGCGKQGGGGPTAPTSVGVSGAPPTFVDEGGRNLAGAHPAPVIVGGTTLLYLNSQQAGSMVPASADGLSFANMPANYPPGISRSIVALTDGRFRMYYFADGTTADVSSAISSDGLNWTVEPGARYSDPNIGAIRALAVPGGSYRIYYPNGSGLTSLISNDGLSFAPEGPVTMTGADNSYAWGPSAPAYIGGQYHMVITRTPNSTGVSELWHAVSADGRNWTLDRSVLAANPGTPINQPAWGINGSTNRVYFRVLAGNSSLIASGTIRF
jgi:hypothetical protein